MDNTDVKGKGEIILDSEKIKSFVNRLVANKKLAMAVAVGVFAVILGATVGLTVVIFSSGDDPGPEQTDLPSLESTTPTTGYEEIISLMEGYIAEYQQQKFLKVIAGDVWVELSAARASAPVDYDDLRNYLAEIGVDPKIVADYRTVASAMNITDPEINTEYIAGALSKLQQNLDPGGDGWYKIRGEHVTVYKGQEHLSFDKYSASEQIVETFKNKDYSDLVLEISKSKAKDPDWDRLYEEFCYEPVNARYAVDENGRTIVIESSDGRDIDLDEIKESYRTGDWTHRNFRGFAVKPEIDTEDIDNDLFRDVLGTKTTTYDTSEYARAHNIELAANSIDGCIILPGYKFSFNNIVGERTEERGYQDALIYINDGIEPGLGGGICQVSSTLYNASLEACLKQDMRECHQFTVFYVDLGMDATVAWGNIDYIFVNNTDHPIKIQSTAKNGKLTMSIMGTADYETREVSFRYKVLETYDSFEIVTLDERLAPGTKNVTSHGRPGYKVDTYRTVIKDGVKYAEEWVATSIYDPLDTKVVEGPPRETTAVVTTTTKATTTTATPPPATTAKPETSSSAAVVTGTTPPVTANTGTAGENSSSEPPAA